MVCVVISQDSRDNFIKNVELTCKNKLRQADIVVHSISRDNNIILFVLESIDIQRAKNVIYKLCILKDFVLNAY